MPAYNFTKRRWEPNPRPRKVSVWDLEPITERTFTEREHHCVGCGVLVDREGGICLACCTKDAA